MKARILRNKKKPTLKKSVQKQVIKFKSLFLVSDYN